MKIKQNDILFAMIFILSVGLIGAVSIASPSASSTISGTGVVLNASNVTFSNMVNCTFYAGSTLTANTSWANIGFFTNSSSSNSVNGTFNSRVLQDANNYIVNATCTNSSNSIRDDTNTGITVDNTIPQAPSSLIPTDASRDTDGSVLFNSTVVGVNTTSCTLNFVGSNPGSSRYTMTHTGNDCSYSLSSIPEQTYQWYITASDETNTTNSATNTITLDITTSAGKVAKMISEGEVKSEGGASFSIVDNGLIGKIPKAFWIVLITLIILIGIYYFFIK